MPENPPQEPGPFESRLRQARREAGLTRPEVATRLGDGFSEASLHRWENGSAEPPFDRVRELADLYDVSLDWLAGRTECRITHRFDHQKVVLDGDRYARFMSLKRGDRVPEDLVAASFLGVFQIPEKNVMVLGGDAMEAVGRRIASQAKELSQRRF
jgi:transcriptional regulator with XRE-family HTH domain